MLEGLERADGAPELLAGLGVIDREVERSLRAPDLLGGQQGPGERTEPGREIVRRRTGSGSDRIVNDSVALTRATRIRDDIRQGSSVRGAIDLALITAQLCAMRGVPVPADGAVPPPRDLPTDYTATVLDAMMVALSGRIHLDDTAFTTPEGVLTEIWQDHFVLDPAAAEPG